MAARVRVPWWDLPKIVVDLPGVSMDANSFYIKELTSPMQFVGEHRNEKTSVVPRMTFLTLNIAGWSLGWTGAAPSRLCARSAGGPRAILSRRPIVMVVWEAGSIAAAGRDDWHPP